MVRWPPGSVYAARRGQSAAPATSGFWRSGRIVRVGTPDAPGSFRVIARFWRQRGRVRSGTILPERHFSPRGRVPQGMNQTQLRRMGRVGRSELERDRTGVRQRPTQTSDRGRRSDLAPAATQRSTRPDEPDDRVRLLVWWQFPRGFRPGSSARAAGIVGALFLSQIHKECTHDAQSPVCRVHADPGSPCRPRSCSRRGLPAPAPGRVAGSGRRRGRRRDRRAAL